MSIALGPLSLQDIAVPPGIDTGELYRYQLETGLTDSEVITLATTMIGMANEEVVAGYGGMIYFTRNDHSIYRQGSGTATMTPMVGEFVNPDPVRGQQTGHMYVRHDFEDSVELGQMFKKRGDPAAFINSVQEIADRWKNRVDYEIINRALNSAEVLIGTQGYSVPWAIGSGQNVNYVPPAFYGKTFDSTHTHFNIANTSSSETWATLITLMAANLREHGYNGTLTLLVNQADALTISALANFARVIPGNIQINSGNSGAPIYTTAGEVSGVPGQLVGFYIDPVQGMVEVRWHQRMPAGYGFMFQSFGNGAERNPLAIRVDPEGFGLMVQPRLEPTYSRRVEALRFMGTFGVSINHREGAAAGQIGAGVVAFANPVVT